MSDMPGAWALLFVARAVRGGLSGHRALNKGWIARMLCRLGIHAWSLASPRYFVCTRCGKTKGM